MGAISSTIFEMGVKNATSKKQEFWRVLVKLVTLFLMIEEYTSMSSHHHQNTHFPHPLHPFNVITHVIATICFFSKSFSRLIVTLLFVDMDP